MNSDLDRVFTIGLHTFCNHSKTIWLMYGIEKD